MIKIKTVKREMIVEKINKVSRGEPRCYNLYQRHGSRRITAGNVHQVRFCERDKEVLEMIFIDTAINKKNGL